MIKTAISQRVVFGILFVSWSDGSVTNYDATEVGTRWFKMSNDAFCDAYGFNFNPHEPGLYERCRRIVFSQE